MVEAHPGQGWPGGGVEGGWPAAPSTIKVVGVIRGRAGQEEGLQVNGVDLASNWGCRPCP